MEALNMPNARKFPLVSLVLAGLLAAAGCGKKAGSPEGPAAAINGPGGGSAGTSGEPASKTQPPLANPVVTIRTRLGDIVVELDPQAAPITTDEFLSYVKKGHYDGTIFHQVIKDQAIVAGQYLSDLTARPGKGPPFTPNEAPKAAKAGLRNVRNTIAMMRDPVVTDSADSQFFINVQDNPALDYKGTKPEEYGYCPFGRVIKGMDVVQRIAQVQVQVKDIGKDKPPFEQLPVEPVVITQVIIR
jgi:peptidyl-prolyl cis-trans isomerase B (cyclophilin B)